MTHSETIDEILRIPWVVSDYQAWLREKPDSVKDDYLFTQSRIRFAPNDADRLIILDSATVVGLPGQAGIQFTNQVAPVAVPATSPSQLESIISALRERPLLIELPLRSGVSAATCDQLLRIGFGQFIFAPAALDDLESRASAAEIVRFPASPYEIVRNYWANVGHLSSNVVSTMNALTDASSFVRWLRSLHVQLLLGADFSTYYCPSSPIARKRVAPGALYARDTRTITSPLGTFILDGPRINAGTVGGPQYHRLLQRSLGNDGLTADDHEFKDNAVYWGRLVKAQARSDDHARCWFLPPRPMREAHWDMLWQSWSSAMDAVSRCDQLACIDQLGRFHWYFVHLHPFACANQSLSFALINCLLRRLTGSGIPQLVLDHLAMRLNCTDYVRLFARAVSAWGTTESSPALRHQDRMRKRQLLDKLISRLDATQDEAQATSLSNESYEATRLALLEDG